MNIKLLLGSNSETWDLSNTVEEITVTSTMYDTPGKCEFKLIGNGNYPNGSVVSLTIDNIPFFYGYVFNNEIGMDNKTSIMAYDQMRYLKNEDTIYFEDKTVNQIFEDVCKRNNLKCKIVNPSSWKVLGYLYDKQSMFQIIKHGLEETEQMTNQKFMIRDNYGVLEFIDVAKQKTNLIIGDKSTLTDYSLSWSIDDDTYNVIKLIRDNKETNKRDVWQVQDGETVKKWGKLQFLQTVDEHANEEQIKELAKNILLVKNRETRKISLSALGFYNIKAGDGIKVKIDNVIDEWFFLSSVTTKISNNLVTMDLEVYLI